MTHESTLSRITERGLKVIYCHFGKNRAVSHVSFEAEQFSSSATRQNRLTVRVCPRFLVNHDDSLDIMLGPSFPKKHLDCTGVEVVRPRKKDFDLS